MRKPTQCEMIIRYLQDNGSITPVEALDQLGCFRLAARISDIKHMGIKIMSETVSKQNRYGRKVRFKRYMLEAEP